MDQPLCLIVDDEPALRKYLRVLLQRKGIQSLEAESAVEALRILNRIDGKIDLLITDIQMPGDIDGVALAQALKDRFSFVPVILISGGAETAPTGFRFVRKPFSAAAILDAVGKAMIRTRAGGT